MANDGKVSLWPELRNQWTRYGSSQAFVELMLEWERPQRIRRVEFAVCDVGCRVPVRAAMEVPIWKGTEGVPVQEALASPRRPIGGQRHAIRIKRVEAARLRVFFHHQAGSKSGVSKILVWKR